MYLMFSSPRNNERHWTKPKIIVCGFDSLMPMANEAISNDELPLVYRLILKVPRIGLDNLSMEAGGLFWVLILPLFITGEFLANLLLLTCVPFPFNYVSVILFNSTIALFIIRVLVERTLNSERALLAQGHFEWKIEETFDSYLQSLKKKDKKKTDDGS